MQASVSDLTQMTPGFPDLSHMTANGTSVSPTRFPCSQGGIRNRKVGFRNRADALQCSNYTDCVMLFVEDAGPATKNTNGFWNSGNCRFIGAMSFLGPIHLEAKTEFV